MKLTIKTKLVLHSCTLVIATVLMCILASVFLSREQIRTQNASRLGSAAIRFERLIHQNINGLTEQFNEFMHNADLTRIMLNCIQQDYFYFPSMPDLMGMGPAMALDRFALYFPTKFKGADILQIYYDKTFEGLVRVKSGTHLLNRQKGSDIMGLKIDDPGIFPKTYRPEIPFQMMCSSPNVYVRAHFPYINAVDASDFGSTFKKGETIGYFIMEKPLSEDLWTMDLEMGVHVSLYDYKGAFIGGKRPMPDIAVGGPFSKEVVTLKDAAGVAYDAMLTPVQHENMVIGHVSFSIPQAVTTAKIRENALWLSGVIGLFGSVIALVVALLITRSITRPLARIVSMANAVARGYLNHDITVNREDEVGVLARAFLSMENALAQALEETDAIIRAVRDGDLETRGNAEAFSGGWRNLVVGINALADAFAKINAELMDAKDSLEGRVRERTRELAEANQELLAEITERERLEEQLRHAQKMEAIGRLAGGIAHDFNNIITAIIGYGNLLQLRMAEEDPLRIYVDGFLAASERAAGLTQNLLAFGRKQLISPKPLDVNETVGNIGRLLQRVISEDIAFRTMFSDEKLTVMADSGQIEQVLMNLATNARDAMPKGGVLTIATSRMDLTTEITGLYGALAPGPYAVIAVSDTGAGMDEDERQKIFEPFFTSKETGKGTGLGLSIVYGIIKQHNGEINVYSEPGKGTTFKIYLKLIPSEDEKAAPPPVPDIVGGSETILIAEDDQDVRQYMVSILEEFGYTVIEAADGDDAVRQFERHGSRVDLLLFDVVMPNKNGKEAYDAISATSKNVPVLFTSGYTADIIHNKGVIDRNLNFISKPVSPRALLAKIRETLLQ